MKIFPNLGNKYLVDEDQGNLLPLLNLAGDGSVTDEPATVMAWIQVARRIIASHETVSGDSDSMIT